MSTTLTIVIMTAIVILATIIPTFILSRRESTSADSWAAADRSLPIYVVIGTQFASVFGGGTLVGHVASGYTNGVAHLIYVVLVCSPLLILMILAKWIRKHNFTTIPEILGSFTDNNKAIRVISAIMTIIVPFGWITSQITAFGSIYAALTGINYNLLCIVFASVALLFLMPSGLKTVAWTDFIFACFILVMCGICAVRAMGMAGGVDGFMATVNPDLLSMSASVKQVGWSTILLWVFAILPGGVTNQLYFQRVCAIKDEKQVNRSLLLSFIACIIGVGWAVYMGIVINAVNPDITDGAVTGWFISKLPTPLLALFAALIFATMMSTLDSGAQSVVVNITRDIIPAFRKEPLDPKAELKLSRILSVAIMVIALLMCLVFTDTLGWLTATYAYSAAALFCPIYVGYILRKKNFVTTAGIGASMVGGVVGAAIAAVLKTAVNYAAVGIGLSFICLLVVSALTREKKTA